MYPFSFDEFLMAQGFDLTIDFKKKAGCESPLPETAHRDLVDQLRSFYLVGGMPAAVTEWVETRSYLEVAHVHHDIIDTYQDDFSKYKKRVSPVVLRQVLRSVALQVGGSLCVPSQYQTQSQPSLRTYCIFSLLQDLFIRSFIRQPIAFLSAQKRMAAIRSICFWI